jgi:hypothetical protein
MSILNREYIFFLKQIKLDFIQKGLLHLNKQNNIALRREGTYTSEMHES